MNKLRVLYSFPLRLGTPGIGMTAWYQVRGLLREGIQVEVCCGSCERSIPELASVRQTLVPCGIKLPLRWLGRDRVMALHDRTVAKRIKRLSRELRIDLVHCWPSGSLETLKMARACGIRTVLERPCANTRSVYESTTRECERLGIVLNKGHYAAIDEKRLEHEEAEFALADRLLCPSAFVVKTFQDRGFPKEKIGRDRYGYDPEVFSVDEPAAFNRDDRPFQMVFVGEGNPLKGLHYALKAWGLSEVSKRGGRFFISGNWLPEYREAIGPLLQQPGVEYLGFLQNVAQVMHRCDALVLPSLSEGCPLVTCEAQACGCILLVSEAAGEVCRHMENGMIHKAGDVEALRQHIDLLASDRDLRRRLRANTIEHASRWTWWEASKSLVAAYQECLDTDFR